MPSNPPELRTIWIELRKVSGSRQMVAYSPDENTSAWREDANGSEPEEEIALRAGYSLIRDYKAKGKWYFAQSDDKSWILIKADRDSTTIER